MFKLLAAALALVPAPALADVTARYAAEKQILLVEVDDGGDARIGVDGRFGVIHRGGTDYLVVVTPTGEARVTELAALVTMMAGAMAATGEKIAVPGADSMQFELTAKGAVTVAGRAGAAWTFGPVPKAGAEASARRLEVVMSADPVLAPVGNVFRRLVETGLPIIALALPAKSGFAAGAAQLVAKGTPLRVMDKFELQSADTAEIDPKRFELPAPVLPAIEFLQAVSGKGGMGDLPPLP